MKLLPLTKRTRERIIRELVSHEQPEMPSDKRESWEEWDDLKDEELVKALDYNRAHKLQALAATITESEN